MSDVDGAALGAGTEGRRWVDGRQPVPAQPQRYETTEREQRIPMRDGISLAATIIEPALTDGSPPQPCIVVTNGYSGLDVWLYPNLRRLAGHGYPVVAARLRGVPPSEGKGGLYEHYGPDGYDVIEWTAAQPFCDGRVGMAGASLLGISQWLAAKEQPPHLVVVAPDDSPNDTYSYLWYVGGMEPGPGRKGRAEVPGVESEYGQSAAHRGSTTSALWCTPARTGPVSPRYRLSGTIRPSDPRDPETRPRAVGAARAPGVGHNRGCAEHGRDRAGRQGPGAGHGVLVGGAGLGRADGRLRRLGDGAGAAGRGGHADRAAAQRDAGG